MRACLYRFLVSRLASALRKWRVGGLAAAGNRKFHSPINFSGSADWEETGVDREVHATAGREAGATGLYRGATVQGRCGLWEWQHRRFAIPGPFRYDS